MNASYLAVVCQQVVYVGVVTNGKGPAKLWIDEARSEGGSPMNQHPNARLAPRGREGLVKRVRSGEAVSEVARQMRASRQTASKWLARARAGEPVSDRTSRPRRLARLTPREVEDRVAGRAEALPAFIDRCNWDRPRSACGSLPPMPRIAGVNNLFAHNS